MKANVKIRNIDLTVEVESDNEVVRENCQRILDGAAERFEHVMAEAVRLEIIKMLPGVNASCVAALSDEEDEGDAE